jgi:hypothetical protein
LLIQSKNPSEILAQDGLPDGDQRTFIVSVRDEAGHVVLRAALSLIVEYPSMMADRR